MSDQDLAISLVGKDVSASDAFRALARAANQAAKSASTSIEGMNKEIGAAAKKSADETDLAYENALAKMAKARRLATIENAKAYDDMGRKIVQSSNVMGDGINNSGREATSRFGDKLASWGQSTLTGILAGITASVTSTVTGVLADAGSAILSQLKSSVIDYNGQLEQATIGFSTMLGSSGKAQAFLDQLQAFAKRTPFEFGDLTTYSQQMLAYGVQSKNVIPYLSALGDAAAGAGKSSSELGNAVLAFNQIAARGKVDLGDLNQLTNAGVPALAILADKYGVTKGQLLSMVSAGRLASDDALPKLVQGIEKGTKSTAAFGGMMDKQSATLQGAMSNIQDAMNQTLSKAFLPFFKVAEQGANVLAKFAGSKQVTQWANDTSKSLGRFVSQIGKAFNLIGQDKGVQAALKRLGPAVSDAFGQIGPAVQKILPNMVKFGRDALPGIIDGLVRLTQSAGPFLSTLVDMSKELAANGKSWGDFASNVGGFINDLFGFFRDFNSWSQDLAKTEWTIRQGFYSWLADLGKLPAQFGEIGQHLVQGFINGITGMWGGVMSTVSGLINKIPAVARKLLGIASPSKVFQQIGSWVGQGLTKGLLGSTSQISAASSQMSKAITTAFSNKQISKSVEQNALADLKRLTDSNSKLRTLATQREKIQDKLASLKSDRSSLQTSTYEATRSAGDITSFGAPGDAVIGLQQLIGKTNTFTSDLAALSKKGIGQRMLSQLVSGWQSDPDNALKTAQGLLSNPTDLKSIISLQTQLQHAAGSLGRAAGADLYGADIAAATGKAKVIGWEMQKAAAGVVKTVSRDLHVHVNLSGTYAGTKESLAKTVTQAIRDEIKKGAIPKNWNTA